MNDLLQRMLAVDKEADALVQRAEEEAAQLAEQTRLQISRENEEAQTALLQESDALLQAELDKAHQEAEAALKQDELYLEQRKAAFAQRIAPQTAPVLDIILGTAAGAPPPA